MNSVGLWLSGAYKTRTIYAYDSDDNEVTSYTQLYPMEEPLAPDGTLWDVYYDRQEYFINLQGNNINKVLIQAVGYDSFSIDDLTYSSLTIDTTSPVVTLLGEDPVDIYVGDSYTDAGATALDDVDGNITANIITSNSVNINAVGIYTVTYNVSDAAGNSATQVTRTVNVVAVPVVLNGIAITTPATKLSYFVGDTLDITGLVITGTYSDATTQVETITTANITGFDSSSSIVGQVLTITVGGKTTTYTVNIVAVPSSAKDINVFSFSEGNGVITGNNIAVTVPFGTNVATLIPTIIITGVSVNPASGIAQDFTNPVTYTVTAEDSSTQVYTVTVTISSNPTKDITSFSFAGITPSVTGVISGTDIILNIPYGTDVTTLVPTIAITGASVNPASGVAQDFTSPVTYTVTAADATTQVYTVTVIVAAPSDLTALVVAIATAQGKYDAAVEGDFPGQYPAPLKANLQTAINTASTITSASVQSVVDTAVITLNTAVAIFEAGIVPPDTVAPVITLQGMGIMDIYVGSIYVDAGATALDNVDGNITANIVAVNPVNLAVVGTYTITYNVSDIAGNHAVQVTRIVNVLPVSSFAQFLGENTTVSTSTPEILVGDNNTASSIITIPDSVTNATINVSALTTSTATSTTATIQGAMTINASTTIGAVNVEIPAGIQIVAGTSTWSGIINVPQVKANSTVTATPDSGNTATVSSVIEIGFGNTLLNFNKAVRMNITGQAGKYVGYSRNEVFTPITNVCSADSQAAGDALSSGGDCKISIGSDLIIWTKHFTNFVTYTQTAIPTSAPASGGGGGGGGGGGSYTPPSASIKGDINNDKKVNKYDFALIMANWGKTGSNNSDLNGDNKVDKYDFALLMLNWSK